MNFDINRGPNAYETPIVMEMEVVSEGLLCASSFTELENYDVLEELEW